jgi:hypothetical protein
MKLWYAKSMKATKDKDGKITWVSEAEEQSYKNPLQRTTTKVEPQKGLLDALREKANKAQEEETEG